MVWDIYLTEDMDTWLRWLSRSDPAAYERVITGIEQLGTHGPALGLPLIARVGFSKLHNIKELRPGHRGSSELRVIFIFDPWRSAVLLICGGKSRRWLAWYRKHVPVAERLYIHNFSDGGL